MRKFRYIEPGHGSNSLSNHEINELDVDFDIQTEVYYALMPVTKAEFNLLRDLNNMDWKRDEYKLPGYDPTAEVPVDRPGVYPKKPSAEKSWRKTWKLADDIPEPTKTIQPDGSVKLSSVVAKRFIQMDQNIQEFIRQEVEAALDRREDAWTEGIDEPDINPCDVNPVVKTSIIQFCTSCNNVVHPDPYNNNYLICSCSLIGQVDPHDRDNVPSWHPASVEIRMKKEEI